MQLAARTATTPFDLAIRDYQSLIAKLAVGVPLAPFLEPIRAANAELRAGRQLLVDQGASNGLLGMIDEGIQKGGWAAYWVQLVDRVSPGAPATQDSVNGIGYDLSVALQSARIGAHYATQGALAA